MTLLLPVLRIISLLAEMWFLGEPHLILVYKEKAKPQIPYHVIIWIS